MARYAVSLVLQHRYPVESVLVLLRPEGAPRSIPEEGVYELGKTKVTHAFRTVRFWELDPEPILRAKDPRLLPWAVIMKTSDAQVRQIARYLVSHGDEELLGRFLAIGPLRYDKKELEEMTGGTSMGIVEAILEGSSVVREVCERAAEKGKEEGLEQGREGATRDLLRSAVGVRFPGLETLPELGAMPAANLHAFFEEVLRSTNREQIEAMIRAATAATPGTPSSTPHPDKA
jgi:predicted transposase YdaD